MPKKPKTPPSAAPAKPDLSDRLAHLHNKLTEELIARIESGAADASDLSVARQLLKDNGVNATPKIQAPIFRLSQAMPFEEGRQAV